MKKVVFGEILASIRKSGLEIKNRCTQEGLNGEILASILKSEPEIKNRCTQEGLNGEILASIPKSGLEIKNRCTLALRRRSVGGTILLRCSEEWNRTRTSLPLRPLQAAPFFFAATKIRIGRGPRRRYGRCRRNHSPLRRRKLESDADLVAATAAAGETISFAAAENGVGRGPRCRYGRCRRNHSPLRQRRIESDADLVAAL